LLVGLVALLALLGFAVLAHALVTVVRARRRDFAMLRALGLSRGQIRAIVIWQVLTLVTGALLLGLFVGVILGRFAWLAFAHQLGVASDAAGAIVALLAVAAGAIGVALIAGSLPAFYAARSRPADALHAE
jgi:putative ABC transport system permease protein